MLKAWRNFFNRYFRAASDFLIVGGRYYAYSSPGSHYWFTVLEIVTDKWIFVDAGQPHDNIWLNTGQLIYIQED